MSRRRPHRTTARTAIGGRAAARIVAIAAAGLVLLLGASSALAGKRIDGVPRFGHVFLIIGENADYSHLTASTAPYLISNVEPRSAWLTNYYAATHWSQANYVAMVTGQFTSCEQADHGIACHQPVDNLYHQLDLAALGGQAWWTLGSAWKVWLEAGAGRCDGGGSTCTSDTACPLTGFYTTGNPPILFDDIEGPNGIWSPTTPSAECLANDIPAGTDADGMATFNADLATGNVAAFNTVIPNGCDDGDRSCEPVNNRLTQFDDFLAREVPMIEASPAFGDNGVIIITYDEAQRMGGLAPHNGFGGGGHTVCAIISPLVTAGSYPTQTFAYSLLRTLQDGFAVSPYLGAAADVSALPVAWK